MQSPVFDARAAGPAEPEASPTPPAGGEANPTAKPAPKPRAPAVRYLGFEVTPEGRDYSLQVSSDEAPRTFVLRIPHAAFAARHARFQDAPDLCFRKLGRALAADPELEPGERVELTTAELLDYRDAREPAALGRRRRGAR